MYETILLPTDGSEGAEVAVTEAIDLAAAHDATLHAVYVVSSGAFPTEIDTGAMRTELQAYGERIVESVADLAAEADVDVETAVLHGPVARQILDYADETGADLVVMGTRGRTGIGRIVVGSVAETVIRRSTVPVHTVPMRPADEE